MSVGKRKCRTKIKVESHKTFINCYKMFYKPKNKHDLCIGINRVNTRI